MKDGIILDVDGTLWNAVSVIRDSWNLYREEQIPEMPGSYTDADIEGVLGLTMTQIGDRPSSCTAPGEKAASGA